MAWENPVFDRMYEGLVAEGEEEERLRQSQAKRAGHIKVDVRGEIFTLTRNEAVALGHSILIGLMEGGA